MGFVLTRECTKGILNSSFGYCDKKTCFVTLYCLYCFFLFLSPFPLSSTITQLSFTAHPFPSSSFSFIFPFSPSFPTSSSSLLLTILHSPTYFLSFFPLFSSLAFPLSLLAPAPISQGGKRPLLVPGDCKRGTDWEGGERRGRGGGTGISARVRRRTGNRKEEKTNGDDLGEEKW